MFWLIWPSSGVNISVLGKLPCSIHLNCSYHASHVYNVVFLGDGPFLCCLCVTVTEAVHCIETTWVVDSLSIHELRGHVLPRQRHASYFIISGSEKVAPPLVFNLS